MKKIFVKRKFLGGMVVMYEYAVDRNSGQFKAPFNEINNEARVFTYKYPVSRSDKGGKV